jgi:hypothetical protein
MAMLIVAERVLEELRHLGGLRARHGHDLVDELAVEGRRELGALRREGRRRPWRVLDGEGGVRRVDALGARRPGRSRGPRGSPVSSSAGRMDLLGGAGVRGALEDDDVAAAEMTCDLLGGRAG